MLPTLQELKAQFGQDKRVVFKEEIVGDETFTIVFYQIADNQFWEQSHATEVRGHVFDSSGKCVSAALEKFFNINEQKWTQQNVLDFTDCVSYEKEDGSQITSLVLNDKVYLKTKKTFYSDVAINANNNIKSNEIDLIKHLADYGYTAIFEYTDPGWEIVVHYGSEPRFTLLAARNITTGKYLPREILESIAIIFDVIIVKEYKLTIEEMLSEVDNITGREGYVILLSDTTRVKLKFDWYIKNHSIKTKLRERDVALMILEETIDDIKASIVNVGYDLTEILKLEYKINNDIKKIREQVINIINDHQYIELKDLCLLYKDHKLFSLIINEYKLRNVDYNKYYKKNFLKNFSYKCLYNKNF